MFREEYQAVCGAAKKNFWKRIRLDMWQLLSWQECLSDWAAC